MNEQVQVLDHGYVRLIAVMGDDLWPVDDARASFDKSSEFGPDGTWLDKDEQLVRDLIELGHWSPLSHAAVKIEVKAPMIVKEQWFKSKVGGPYTDYDYLVTMPTDADEAWNEKSFRYVSRNLEFYVPDAWRKRPKLRKQGSDGWIDATCAEMTTNEMSYVVQNGLDAYRQALDDGIAPEQARLLLPYAALYTKFRWRPSLYRVLSWLQLRAADDAQWEIQEYARAVYRIIEPEFPQVFALWEEQKGAIDLGERGVEDGETAAEVSSL